MRPLPRLLAYADDRIAVLDDLGIRAAAIAAVGPAVALVARSPGATAGELGDLAERFMRLARPPMADVLVSGRADLARATGAAGVILREADLAVPDARSAMRLGSWCFRSVHSLTEADAAIRDGADALVVGSVWPTASHPERQPIGITAFATIASLGVPSFAIGGVDAERASEARDAGAWGVAAIRGVWDAEDPYRAAVTLIAPWLEQ